MKTFVFETTIDALVRVRAADEDSARKVIPTVLGAPGTADIRLANESIGVGLGIEAVIDDVKFNAAPDMACSKSTASASSAAGGDCPLNWKLDAKRNPEAQCRHFWSQNERQR